MNNYHLSKDYISRDCEFYFNDTKNTDEYQDEVYNLAKDLYDIKKLDGTILDIGCGSAFKLIKYFGNRDTIGLEVKDNMKFLKEKYEHRVWVKNDWNHLFHNKKIDLIICADVIEHLLNPDLLMRYVMKLDFKYFILSTVDRSSVVKKFSIDGPPLNKCHVREWSYQEFEIYCKDFFKVKNHCITNEKQATQVCVCIK